MRLPLLAAVLAAGLASGSLAAPFRLCTLDQPFYPFTMPDGSGQTQVLLRRAAQSLSLSVENHVAPRRRCLEELRTGQADGAVGAWIVEREAYAAYPLQNGQPDEARSLAITRFLVYRRPGSAISWDGQRFQGLATAQQIGVQQGFVHVAKLQATHAAYDDGARTGAQNLEKLRLGRVVAAIAQEEEVASLLQGRYRGQIEALETPFDSTVLYLMVARTFYEQNRDLTERYWQAIRTERESASYQKYLQQYR